MKTIKLLLVAFVITFSFAASCERDEMPETESTQCDCVKTFYLYYPAMGSGASYIPAHYDVVSQQVGQFNCSDETSGYVPVSNSQYSHYKIECD